MKFSEMYYMCTIQCNQKCSKCSHWKKHDTAPRLNPELIVHAVKSLPTLNDLTIVGGEPFLYKDEIMHIIKGIANTHVRTVIITNAFALTSEFVDAVKPYKIHFVFSIDTVDREFWKFVRGMDSFDIVMKNLEYAFKTLSPYQMSIQSVLAKETEPYIEGVKAFAERHGLYHGVQDFVSDGFEGDWTPLEKKAVIIPSGSQQCFAAERNISIMQNGDVFTCFQQSWIKNCEKPLGNLIENSIEEIISSDYMAFVQSQMKKCNKSCKVLKCNIQR